MTLADYISERLEWPFAWGSHDCVLFAIGWLSIRAGREMMPVLPKWTNAKEAAAVVESVGGLECQYDQHLTRINPNFARDGDIALVNGTTYLFSGAQIVGPGINGLIFMDRKHACSAWSL